MQPSLLPCHYIPSFPCIPTCLPPFFLGPSLASSPLLPSSPISLPLQTSSVNTGLNIAVGHQSKTIHLRTMTGCLHNWPDIVSGQCKINTQHLQCISGCLSRRDKKWELALFVQVTTAAFISSGFHSAVVTCTNKANSHFFYLFWTSNLKYTVRAGWRQSLQTRLRHLAPCTSFNKAGVRSTLMPSFFPLFSFFPLSPSFPSACPFFLSSFLFYSRPPPQLRKTS